MPRPRRPWLRLYSDIVADTKVRRLEPSERWLWIVVLCAARQSPTPGALLVSEGCPLEVADLADMAALPARVVERAMPRFVAQRMVHEEGGVWVVTNWKERQFEADDVTKRTSEHRSRERRRNVPTSFPGTPPETETDDRREANASAPSKSSLEQARAHALAAQWWESIGGKTPHKFVAVRQIVHRFLNAGIDEERLLAALRDAPTITIPAIEVQLSKEPAPTISPRLAALASGGNK